MENAYEKCLRGAKKMVVPVMLFSVGWTAVSLEAFGLSCNSWGGINIC